MRRVHLALACVLLLLPALGRAAEPPIPPPPARWATDAAAFLSPSALEQADRALEAFERETSNQVVVWIGRTTGDTPLEDWTVKAFEQWRVGRKGLDNGIVLFVFADDRRVRIEVGYGLEGRVPDGLASRIINEAILPRLRAGDRDGAVLAGVDALRAAITGDASLAPPPFGGAAAEPADRGAGALDAPTPGSPGARPESRQLSCGEMVIGGVLIVGFLILLVTNPQLALYILFSILSSGRGGGGSYGGGGGFSGGGGRSGGGGASGSW